MVELHDGITQKFISYIQQMIERGDWQVSDVARNAFDLEGKVRKLENASLASLTQIIRSLVPLELVVSDIVFFNDWYLSIARNSSTMIMRHCPNVCSVGYHPSSSVIHPTLEAGKAVNARRVEDLKVFIDVSNSIWYITDSVLGQDLVSQVGRFSFLCRRCC